ncbi:MAG TPA: hypothetical protein VKV74_17380 [Bryobacteraceae bacterium]|nr:hypothetical protein [Bryobacteraceae bacterium]
MLRRLPLAFILFAAVSAWGQNAISARSGMVNHVEGQVFIEGKAIDTKFGQFPQVNNDETLSTQEGRAEVLLTPGVFLRLAENSSFKMLSNRLSDTAIEAASGSAMLEVDELLKDNAIAVHFKGGTVSLVKQGLYRFDENFARLRVYDGEAHVALGEQNLTARKGKQVVFGDNLVASNFDPKITDPFYRWASRRAEYVSTANISSARTAGQNGLLSSYGNWAWNPWFGMYTFLPGVGYAYSPFGWDFYSPATVGYLYYPWLYGGGGYAHPTVGRVAPPTNNGNAGIAALAPARATPPSESGSGGNPSFGSGGDRSTISSGIASGGVGGGMAARGGGGVGGGRR